MKNVLLHRPSGNELSFRQELLADEKTMSYNAGYDLNFEEYHYDTGCVDFPKSKWQQFEAKMASDNFFYAYIKDVDKDVFIGEVNFKIIAKNIASMGIVIKDEFRGQGYMRPAMQLLVEEAKKRNVNILCDSVPQTRRNALNVFYDLGFVKAGDFVQKKFGKDEIVIKIQKVIKQ